MNLIRFFFRVRKITASAPPPFMINLPLVIFFYFYFSIFSSSSLGTVKPDDSVCQGGP